MECPNCERKLNHSDSYGSVDYIVRGDQNGKAGDIYECANSDGFEDLEAAQNYLEHIGETLESMGLESLEELKCENAQGNRHYYTDRSGNLHEGYPC